MKIISTNEEDTFDNKKYLADKYIKKLPNRNVVISGECTEGLLEDVFKENYSYTVYCDNLNWNKELSKYNIYPFPLRKSLFTKDFIFDSVSTTKEAQDQIKPYKDNIQSMITYDFRVNPPKLWKRIK